jgi:hypothetical protein
LLGGRREAAGGRKKSIRDDWIPHHEKGYVLGGLSGPHFGVSPFLVKTFFFEFWLGFESPSLEGRLELFRLFCFKRRSRSATFSFRSAFSARKAAFSASKN